MSDKKPHKNKDKRQLQKKAPILTPEEQAAQLAAMQKAAEEREAERQRVELYGKNVEKMSHRQLRGELRRTIRREYSGKPPVPNAGLTIALGSILLTVLDNTKSVPVLEGGRRLRKDQINPFGVLESYPR
jgi:hypothetical protein